ncbi:MAG TPA: N-acetylmuramic acid 6-phosphate etherase [Verrucomicrobiae bacterium]|nr:N-acetylmuramic acid 6-phosphate etherase [Verrucomicrobiae bacterium]
MGVELRKAKGSQPTLVLGIEGGGTHTVGLLANSPGKTLERLEFGPLNLKLSTDAQILSALRYVRSSLSSRQPSSVAVCLAGCRTNADRSRVRALAERVWPRTGITVGSDIDSGFAAAFGTDRDGILVVSGTGSCVYGRNGMRTARAGGWGHLLGDHGSGYWIALTGLRHAIRDYDRNGRTTPALRQVLARLCLNAPDQLVDWMAGASKDEAAVLAPIFLRGDKGLLLQAASFLAMDCAAVARKLRLEEPTIALAGGVLRNNGNLRKWVAHRIRTLLPGARIILAPRESATGALKLAGLHSVTPSLHRPLTPPVLPLTEQRNPRTMDLDKRSVSQLIDTMLEEESRVIPALRRNKRAIERAVNTIVAAFRRGGRLFYVGAGTSGRLGVLDASECPPTFSTDPDMVQGIIAGGVPALNRAVEAAEDDPLAGTEAVRNRGVRKRDVVVGIAASGNTPFVLGALDEARRRGAKTFLLSFSKPVTSHHSRITVFTGPEVLTGSTRLKAGTATKLALNMLTTISMIRLGKVVSNLMVDVKPASEKLRARACRIVATLRGCSEVEARQRIERARWNVKRALR